MLSARSEISRFSSTDGNFTSELEQEEEARKFASDQRTRWIMVIDQLISVGIFDSNLLAPYRDFVNTQSHEQFLVTQGRDGSHAVKSSLPLLGEIHPPQIHEDKWNWLAAVLVWFSPMISTNRFSPAFSDPRLIRAMVEILGPPREPFDRLLAVASVNAKNTKELFDSIARRSEEADALLSGLRLKQLSPWQAVYGRKSPVSTGCNISLALSLPRRALH